MVKPILTARQANNLLSNTATEDMGQALTLQTGDGKLDTARDI
jgi:hypothetical protein